MSTRTILAEEEGKPQFAKYTSVKLRSQEIDAFYGAFRFYDIDKSGSLDRNEINHLLADLGMPIESPNQAMILNHAFSKFDVDENGTLDDTEFREFLAFFFEWQYINSFMKCASYSEIDDGRSLIDKNDVKKLITEDLGMEASDEHLEEMFGPKLDVDFSDFVGILDDVRQTRIDAHAETAGFDEGTLTILRKHMKRQLAIQVAAMESVQKSVNTRAHSRLRRHKITFRNEFSVKSHVPIMSIEDK